MNRAEFEVKDHFFNELGEEIQVTENESLSLEILDTENSDSNYINGKIMMYHFYQSCEGSTICCFVTLVH